MSEQTPESTATLPEGESFGAVDDEPSMEDILASIRKIIADDADPVPLDGPSAEADPVAEPAIAQTVAEPEVASASEPEEIDFDAMMEGFDADVMESAAPETSPEAASPLEAAVDSPDAIDALTLQSEIDKAFTIEDGEVSLDASLAIPSISDAPSEEPLTLETPLTLDTPVETDADDMDQLMSDLMGDMDFPADNEPRIEEVGTVTSDLASMAEAIPASAVTGATDEDLDLVKSLMADLTDEDVVPASDGPVIATAIPDNPPSENADMDDLDALEGDILDSILDMTLADEAIATDGGGETVPDLSDIAAAAEADASGETASSPPSEGHAPKPDSSQTDTPELETPMPSAARADAILDDVTEAATMTAFAELNQVVEDKAVLSERGPRIGDLVQDALRPMLKEWLDENLQAIVERAVAKEVKRIADGK